MDLRPQPWWLRCIGSACPQAAVDQWCLLGRYRRRFTQLCPTHLAVLHALPPNLTPAAGSLAQHRNHAVDMHRQFGHDSTRLTTYGDTALAELLALADLPPVVPALQDLHQVLQDSREVCAQLVHGAQVNVSVGAATYRRLLIEHPDQPLEPDGISVRIDAQVSIRCSELRALDEVTWLQDRTLRTAPVPPAVSDGWSAQQLQTYLMLREQQLSPADAYRCLTLLG